jgi:hypothetical protein
VKQADVDTLPYPCGLVATTTHFLAIEALIAAVFNKPSNTAYGHSITEHKA